MAEYISIAEIPEYIGLKKGDRVYLASDVMKLAFACMQGGERFTPDALLDSFMQQLTEEGTLLIPTFHFDFSNKGVYDYRKTPCFTGALGNAALKRSDFKRTLHPMHSFAVWGKDQELLCSMENDNSFGPDSPFAWMKQKNITQVFLGTDYQQGLTFAHYVETCAEVPYRFNKTFKGLYTDAEGVTTEKTCQYPARYLNIGTHEKFNRVGEILEQKGISHCMTVNDIPVRVFRLGDSYDTIYEDAKHNMARNLYDFDCPREDVWSGNHEKIR